MKPEVARIVSDFRKQYKRTVVTTLKDAKVFVDKRISSGSFVLDLILGGGIPLGRILEFYGIYSSGKTMLGLKALAETQKRGGVGLYVDMEGSIQSEDDFTYLEALGVNTEELLIAKPASTEEAMDVIINAISSRKVSLIVYDSIAMATPLMVYEKDGSSDTMGVEPRKNNLLIRKVIASMQPKDLADEKESPWCSFIVINQVRDVLGNIPRPPETTGGWGLKFAKHISVEVKKTSWIRDDETEAKSVDDVKCGQEIKLIVRKNKTFTPYLVGTTRFYFRDIPGLGIKKGQLDLAFELLELGVLYGVIERKGYWFEIDGNKCQGKIEARKFIRQNPEIQEKLKSEIKERFFENYSKLEDKSLVEDEIVEVKRVVKSSDERTEEGKAESKKVENG